MLVSLLGLAALAACGAASGGEAPLSLERTIALHGVAGRIDHLAIDLKRNRLFVAELGNGSVEAIDLARGVGVKRIDGLREPQGLAYLADVDELALAGGGDGAVRFYRGADFKPLATLKLGEDADNLRVDPVSGDLVAGYGEGALAVIDPKTHRVKGTLALPAHPEGFRLDGDRVFVNVPNARRIVVGDLAAGRSTGSWKAAYGWNFPMALDPAAGRLAVVFRLPARLQVLETATGRPVSDLPTCGDADDVFFDLRRGRLYVSCGTGAVDVFQAAPQGYRHIGRISARPGARTSLFVPELDRLFVAARAGALSREAAILVYRPGP
jgi:hypothetical protein